MKHLLSLLLLVTSYTVQAQIPTTGLIACYNFDADANDEVNAYNGTLMGGASASTSLNIGGNAVDALSIPGTILNNVSEYSIAHRVMFTNFNVNHASSSNVIFSGASAANDNLMNFAYAKDQLPGGSVTLQNTVFYIHDNVRYEFNNIDLTAGVWYHFTLVRGTNTLKFYLDGVEQTPIGGVSVPTLNLTLDPNGFIFGQDQDVLAGGFEDFQCLNGSLDDLLIYTRELTDQEVLDIYNFDHSTMNVEENIASHLVSIYPNPTEDILHIAYENGHDPVSSIELYDMKGLKLNKMTNSMDKIDISHLPTGSYIVSVRTHSNWIYRVKVNKL